MTGTTVADADTVTDLCCHPTAPNLRPPGSTPLRIPARPAWLTETRLFVRRFLASALFGGLVAAATLTIGIALGAGYL